MVSSEQIIQELSLLDIEVDTLKISEFSKTTCLISHTHPASRSPYSVKHIYRRMFEPTSISIVLFPKLVSNSGSSWLFCLLDTILQTTTPDLAHYIHKKYLSAHQVINLDETLADLAYTRINQ